MQYTERDYCGRTPEQCLNQMEEQNSPEEIDQIIGDNWASAELAGEHQEVNFWKAVYVLWRGETLDDL